MKYTHETNKIVSAVLMAVVIALGLSFLSELINGHHDEGEPVYVVAASEAESEMDVVGDESVESAVEALVDEGEQIAADVEEAATELAEQAAELATDVVAEVAAEVGAAMNELSALIAEADLGRGEKMFKKCKACHGTDQGGKHKIGPNLWDVVGAPKARHADYKYSAGFAGLGGVWDYAALDALLANPKDYSPGTKMAFPGVKKASDRAAVIAYLRAASDSPAPLE